TGPDGTYTLGSLPAADVRVRFSPCGGGAYIEQWYHDQQSFDSSTPVVLTSGEVRTGVDAQLHTGTQVSGTVTDRNGAPIQYVNVNVNPDGSGPSASGQTDADGHYTTGALPPGNYRVQFQVSGGYAPQFWNDQPSWNNADLLPIPPGGAPIGGINAALDTAASISGHVTSPDGHDAGNVCVVANIGAPRGFDWVGSTTTAADGTYTLSGLPPGAIKVQFVDCNSVGPYLEQWWNGQTDPSSADDVALTPGQARTGIDAHLVAAAQIRGTVTNGSGQPRSGICAQATTATFVGGLATTDAQGHYAITLARAGDYRVQFVDCNQTPTYAGQWWHGQSSPATAAVVMVGTGQVVSGIDAVLVPGAVGSISGKVTAARGVGMPTACVIAYLPTQFAVFGAVQPDGSYEIPNVPSGTYAIAFLGCDGGEPQGIVADPVVPGVTYPGAWWHDVPLDITGTSNGGPDPIAQGANLVTVNPGAHLTGIDNCFGCGAITIDSITPGADDLTVAFGTPILSAHLAAQARRSALAAGVDAAYTLSCSSGSGEAAHTATGSEKELTVTGLTAGATYGCGLIAEVDGTLVATSVDFSAVIPRDASDSGSSGSGRGGSDEPSRFMATTGVTSSLPAARMGVLFVLIGLVLIGATRRSSRTAAETP
ncbi:MAG: carboxypeptidase-like regulatory domain-containing protein, partial [Acidimicrobiia bacterium]